MVRKIDKLKLFVSLLIIVSLLFAFSGTALAESEDTTRKIDFSNTQWEYKILDENGNLISSGIVPNSGTDNFRYSWSGITLANNQTAVFMPSGAYGLYAVAGTRIEAGWTLNRSASHRTTVQGYSHNYTDGNGFRIVNSTYYVVKFFNALYSDYFYGMITNLSSDSFTINNFYIYF